MVTNSLPDGPSELATSARFSAIYASARAGDLAAMSSVVEFFATDLERFIARRVGAALALAVSVDDLFQDTVLIVHESMRSFPSDLDAAEFRAYVLQIAKRRIVDCARQSQRWCESVEIGDPDVDAPRTGEVTRLDELRHALSLVDALPAPQAQILRACVIEGHTIREAASMLGISRDNAKQRLCRARSRLRSMWSSIDRQQRMCS